MRRRDFVKNGSAFLLGLGGCTTTPESAPRQKSVSHKLDVDSWTRIMTASPGNLDLQVPASSVDGAIPTDLFGKSYLLNGPGRLGYGDKLTHPFDGHGYLRAFKFQPDGSVSLKARFIETDVFRVEEKAQRIVVPGIGTLASPGPKVENAPRVRNVANTTVLPFADQLLCGWEGGVPWAVEPETLRTLGPETFGGTLGAGATLAHFRYDATQSRLVTLSPSMGRQTQLTFREFDTSGQLQAERTAQIDGMLFAHDFVLTTNWYILARNPLRIDIWAFVKAQMGTGTLLDAIASDASLQGDLIFVPRKGKGLVQARSFPTPRPIFAIHFANAFEKDDEVLVDVCAFEEVTFGNEFGYLGAQVPYLDPSVPDQRAPQRLVRVAAKPSTGQTSVRQLAAHAIDFPGVDARFAGQNAVFAMGATRLDLQHSDPFDAIASIDVVDEERPDTLWVPGGGRYVGEPVFYPDHAHADPRAGYLVSLVYDGKNERTTLVVLDHRNMQAGPIAAVPFPLLPYGFHGFAKQEGTHA